jgi:hypothetical protein
LNPYGAYLYGDNPLLVIHNNFLHGNKKILIIKDSFVNNLAPFLSLGIEHIDMLDLRHFTGSIKTYIKQTQPDMVIVMYNPSALAMDDSAHKRMFDFR